MSRRKNFAEESTADDNCRFFNRLYLLAEAIPCVLVSGAYPQDVAVPTISASDHSRHAGVVMTTA